MNTLDIAFVYQRAQADNSRALALTAGHARFISELEVCLSKEIPVFDRLNEAPALGFVVFAGADAQLTLEQCPASQQNGLVHRLVPINASGSRIFDKLLEPLSVPAAIDSRSFLEWQLSEPARVGARGLHGLKEVAQEIGVDCLVLQSQRYCLFESKIHRGLPHLLVDYLRALQSRHPGPL